MTLGKFIQDARTKKGLSIRQLAKASGVSNAYISQVEGGKRDLPQPRILKKLADPLGITYEELLREAGHLEDSADTDVNDFSMRLRGLREAGGLTLGEVAEGIGDISLKTISGYENGPNRPNYETLVKFANFYDTTTDYLLGRTDERTSGTTLAPVDPSKERILNELAALHSKLDSLAGEIANASSGIELVSKVLDRVEEHDMDIRLLKKLATKE